MLENLKKKRFLSLLIISQLFIDLSVVILWYVRIYIDHRLFRPEDPMRIVFLDKYHPMQWVFVFLIIINTAVMTLVSSKLDYNPQKAFLFFAIFMTAIFFGGEILTALGIEF